MAATLTADQELTYFSFPIEKVEDAGDGTVEVVGKATDGTLDSDLQIVDPDWSVKALQEWYDTGANVRVQHNAQRDPAGKGMRVDGHSVSIRVVEPVAVKLVKAGVLQDFSVGIMNPDIRRGDPQFKHLDPHGKAVNGIITGRPDGMSKIGEISLVDRGSNFGTRFAMMKAAAADGAPEWVGELTATDEVLAKVNEPGVTKDAKPAKTVMVEMPKNMSVSIKPSDMAKLAALRPVLARDNALAKAAVPRVVGEHGPEVVLTKAATDVDTAELATIKTAEAAVYKRDIDTATRRRLAAEDRALPDLSYPIENHEDANNAATLALSGHGNVSAAKRLIRRVASKEGWTDVLDRLKGKKKDKVAKTATPGVAKCGCDGGMMDGKPCPDCKKGKKASKRMAAKAAKTGMTKKKKVMCGECGARQNAKHAMCSECGKDLAGAIPVMKNHAYTCLGCGKELDKGEKFCPGCGKENPGYLPEADHQIPANQKTATPAGKDRVAKGRKNSGKPRGKTPASASGAVSAPEKPVGPHREPDGAEVDAFEADASMSDGDHETPTKLEAPTLKAAKGKKGGKGKGKGKKMPPWMKDKDGDGDDDSAEKSATPGDPEMAAAMALKALGVPRHMGALHALTCPAYSPESVAKAFPDASFAGIDLAEWQNEAATKAATAPLDQAQDAMALWHNASALRTADPYMLADLREAAHKAFRDANPGPGTFPAPGEIGPGRFSRPYISEGHGAASPQAEGPHHAKLPEVGGVNSQDYTRPYLSAGHASESPDNQHTSSPMPTPAQTGVPTAEPGQHYVSTTATEGASHALSAMHDHISRVFPDICPMQASLGIASHPVPVPVGVPSPSKAPGARKSARKAAKAAERKAVRAGKRKAAKIRKKAVAKRRAVESKVLKGKMTVDDGRAKLGLKPAVTKAATADPTAATETPAPSEADTLAAALKAATAPMRKQLRAQDKALRKVRKTTDAIASQPDTSSAPFRGVALPRTSAAPAGPLTVSASAEQAQITKMRLLHDEWRNSPSPEQREAAYGEYTRLLGIAPMTPTQT